MTREIVGENSAEFARIRAKVKEVVESKLGGSNFDYDERMITTRHPQNCRYFFESDKELVQ